MHIGWEYLLTPDKILADQLNIVRHLLLNTVALPPGVEVWGASRDMYHCGVQLYSSISEKQSFGIDIAA